jgi:hypothetical protein
MKHVTQEPMIRLTVSIEGRQLDQLDRVAVQRTVEAGRPVTRSAVARELLERALRSDSTPEAA